VTTDPLNAFISRPERPAPAVPGPLSGLAVGVKDLIATAGLRTTAGSAILRDWIPRRDAPVVAALKAAGAWVAGKTNTHEFAYGTTNDNPHYGPSRNPWNPELTTGGSSGGSAAAVAAGMVTVALGTDTAGSVRIPAALCGCVGFKPARGALPVRGVVPLAPTLDTVGLLTATVAQTAEVYAALTGSPHRAAPATLSGLRIGVVEAHAFDRVEDPLLSAVEEALRVLECLGAQIRRIAIAELANVLDVGVPIVRSEAAAFHRRWFPARKAEYGADVARALEAGQAIPAREYLAARQARRRLSRAVRSVLAGDLDLLAGPTVPLLALPNRVAWEPVGPGGELPRHALTRLTYPFSLARLPAISVPCGLANGLPVGLQLAARTAEMVLAAASAFETARGPMPRPPVWLGD